MSKCFICNFIKRSFLYQILIIIASLKLRNAFRFNREFVQRISEFITSINLPEKLLNYLPKNHEITHKGFLISLIVFASFSIINLNFFKILSGLGCILLGFLYHNPIPKIKILLEKNEPFSWTLFEQNLPEMEFILYICLAFAMFGNAFCSGTCDKEKKENNLGENENTIIKEEKNENKKVNKKENKKDKKEGQKNSGDKNQNKKSKKKKE